LISERAFYFALLVAFDDIAHADVIDALDADTAFEARLYFRHIVLEALEGIQLASVYNDTVADEADGILTFDVAVRDHTPGNRAHLGYPEHFTDFSIANAYFFHFWRQHAFHGILHVVDSVVDDGVQTDFDLFLLGNPFRGSRSEEHTSELQSRENL